MTEDEWGRRHSQHVECSGPWVDSTLLHAIDQDGQIIGERNSTHRQHVRHGLIGVNPCQQGRVVDQCRCRCREIRSGVCIRCAIVMCTIDSRHLRLPLLSVLRVECWEMLMHRDREPMTRISRCSSNGTNHSRQRAPNYQQHSEFFPEFFSTHFRSDFDPALVGFNSYLRRSSDPGFSVISALNQSQTTHPPKLTHTVGQPKGTNVNQCR
jgi:hypothetical protein